MPLDFFKGVNNLNQGRKYQRNDSGRDFIRGPLSSPSSPQSRSIQDRKDANENIHLLLHRQQDHHVSRHGGGSSTAHPYPSSHQDYPQHQYIPNEHPRSLGNAAATNYNNPNGPFFHASPFPYNYEAPPRTSAHFHGCPTCSSPIMVQVTANVSYHHVTLIPATTARTNEMPLKNSFTDQSTVLIPSHGAQEYSPNPESIPQTYGPEESSSDDDSLSNDMVVVPAAFEMVTAGREEVQPLLSVETKERRSYASITAGKTIITENNNKPLEEEADDEKPQMEEEANNDKPPAPQMEEEANNVKPLEEEAKDNNNNNKSAYDINGFTTVVSSKSKKKAKAEAKAAAIAECRKMFNKHRRRPQRNEHDKQQHQHHGNDRGVRREHDQHAKGGPRDANDKHRGNIGHDMHRAAP